VLYAQSADLALIRLTYMTASFIVTKKCQTITRQKWITLGLGGNGWTAGAIADESSPKNYTPIVVKVVGDAP